MKKVNLIGKKIISAGLAASLFVTSLGNTSCFADKTEASTQTVSTQDESGNITNVTVQVINNSKKSNKSTPEKKDVSVNKKEGLKKSFKKAFDVTKWILISGFLTYYGYKNGKDIINCLKECGDFVLENKDNFKEVLDGGIAAAKGLGNAAKGTAQLFWKIILFAAEHPKATKNVIVPVGAYSIYKIFKYRNRNKNFINKKDNKKVGNSFKLDDSITIKQ